jgi:PPOX class probable F420-dependent enzyme
MDMNATSRPRSAADRGRGYQAYVLATTVLAGAATVAVGLWALAAPRSFADFVDFPYHEHFLHDVGAFQLGIGTTLLLAVAWRDGLALALAGFLVGNSVHAVNHAVDLHLGGHGWDPWALAVVSLVTFGALVVRLRELGWVVGEVTTTAAVPALEPFVRQKTILLTSYRRDGTAVSAPVSIVVEGRRAFVRSPAKGGKVKRIRNNPMVEIAPSTTRGRPTGPAIRATARRLDGAESSHAGRLLDRKYPFLQAVLVRLAHRLFRGKTGGTAHLELTAVDGGELRDGAVRRSLAAS